MNKIYKITRVLSIYILTLHGELIYHYYIQYIGYQNSMVQKCINTKCYSANKKKRKFSKYNTTN